MELYSLTITEVRDLLYRREISVQDLLRSIYGRIHLAENKVKAFVTITEETAMQIADEVQNKTEQKTQPLLGIPLAMTRPSSRFKVILAARNTGHKNGDRNGRRKAATRRLRRAGTPGMAVGSGPSGPLLCIRRGQVAAGAFDR